MDLIDYAKILWTFRWFIFLIMVLIIGVTALTTLATPPVYKTSIRLEVGQALSYFGAEFTGSKIDLEVYIELINDPFFKEKVRREATKKRESIGDFKISAQQKEESGILTITVETGKAQDAKILADAAATVLMEEDDKLSSEAAIMIRQRIQKQIEPVDVQLAKLRKELELLKEKPTASTEEEKIVKVSHLQDKILAVEAIRRTYTDFLARVALAQALRGSNIRMIYPATVPIQSSGPELINNLLGAAVVGLLLAVGSVVLIGYRQRAFQRRKW